MKEEGFQISEASNNKIGDFFLDEGKVDAPVVLRPSIKEESPRIFSSFPKKIGGLLPRGIREMHQWYIGRLKTKKAREESRAFIERLAATYFSTNKCSIIGDAGLNFSVRNGKR